MTRALLPVLAATLESTTDGILVVVSRHLRGIEVLDGATRVRCQPGAVGSWVNAALAPHGREIALPCGDAVDGITGVFHLRVFRLRVFHLRAIPPGHAPPA